MNEQEHKQMQTAARAVAAEHMYRWQLQLIEGLLRTLPVHERPLHASAMKKKLLLAREDRSLLTFPEMHPAMSDLWAGEAQEAFDLLAKEFESCLVRSVSNE